MVHAKAGEIHSERALGIWLYGKAGYSSYITALSGHATEKMMNTYADGHEKAEPILIQSGLSLEQIQIGKINWETDINNEIEDLVE